MKKFKISIDSPCNANLQEMQKTNSGFFCLHCTKDVIDFTELSNYEISKFISENKNSSICARMKTSQLQEEFSLIEHTKVNRSMKYAAVAASVLAISSLQAQEMKNTKSQNPIIQSELKGNVGQATVKENNKEIKIKGKIIDKVTKLPINDKKFGNLYITIIGFGYNEKINHRKGTFVFREVTKKDNKKYILKLFSDNHFEYQSEIEIDFTKTQQNILNLIIEVDTTKFKHLEVLGGATINTYQ